MKTLKDLFRDYRFVVSFTVLFLLVIMALLSFVCPQDITLWGLFPRDLKPAMEYLLGTDANEQDIFWNATFAVRNSLIISLIAWIVSRVIAIIVGMIAGYKGGTIDRVLMFIDDSLLVIPLLLVMVMLSMMVREFMNLFDLGTMLNWALNYQAILLQKWNWILTPVVLSVCLFVALYWLSVSISEYLDPRTRIQRVGT